MLPRTVHHSSLRICRDPIPVYAFDAVGETAMIAKSRPGAHHRRIGLRSDAAGARAHRHGRRRALRPGRRRSALPGHRLGDGQRADLCPAHAHERGRKRHGKRRWRAGPPLEDPRHPSRCAAGEERGHHRGDSREGPRQVRQAGRRHRRAAAGDQPARHDGQHGHQRHQVPRRGDLLAASVEQEDRSRDRARAACRAAQAGCARGSGAVPRAAEHSARAAAHVGLRSDDRDRRHRDGEGRLQLGQARLRRRRGQCHGGDRRNRQSCRRGEEHPDQQDAESWLGLLVRWQPAGRGDDLRPFLQLLQDEGGYLANAARSVSSSA